jgi:hypothetical protein
MVSDETSSRPTIDGCKSPPPQSQMGRDTIEGLEDKAELSRSEYYTQIRKYELRVNLLKGLTLFGSITVAVLALMDQSYFGPFGLLVIAIIGFLLALVAFIDTVFSQTELLAEYRKSAKEYTKFIRDCHAYLKAKKKGNANIANEDSLRARYENLIENSPDSKLGKSAFLRHKRIHLMSIEISRMISADPFDERIDEKMTDLEKELEKAGMK